MFLLLFYHGLKHHFSPPFKGEYFFGSLFFGKSRIMSIDLEFPHLSPTRWGWVQWRMCWRLTSQGGDPLRRAWWWRKPLQDHPRTKQDALPEVKTRLITEVQGKNVCLQLFGRSFSDLGSQTMRYQEDSKFDLTFCAPCFFGRVPASKRVRKQDIQTKRTNRCCPLAVFFHGWNRVQTQSNLDSLRMGQ